MELYTSISLLIDPRINFKAYFPVSESFYSRDALCCSQGDLYNMLTEKGGLEKDSRQQRAEILIF